MKGRRTTGMVLLVAGVLILILAAAADYIGMGAFPGFGYKQIVGTIVGVIMSIVGLALLSKRVKVIQ